MKLKLIRKVFTDVSTIGELLVVPEDGGMPLFQCYTLEDTVRPAGEKVFGKTAIPAGTYIVTIDHSVHFNRSLPHILDVPNFEGVRIHSGNRPEDTEGCVLVGLRIPKARPDCIEMSRAAFDPLFQKMQAASTITIEIANEKPEVPAV